MLLSHPMISGVITDIQMPELNGIELIKLIRNDANLKDMVILANTQFGQDYPIQEIINAGADDMIFKPISSTILRKRLHNLLRNQ